MFSGQSRTINSGFLLDLRLLVLTFYMMIFIHHIMTAKSRQQQTCKPSNLEYADTTCRHINTGMLQLCFVWPPFFVLFKLDFQSAGNSHNTACVIKYTSGIGTDMRVIAEAV